MDPEQNPHFLNSFIGESLPEVSCLCYSHLSEKKNIEPMNIVLFELI